MNTLVIEDDETRAAVYEASARQRAEDKTARVKNKEEARNYLASSEGWSIDQICLSGVLIEKGDAYYYLKK